MVKVSVIVPVYRVEAYLPACLDSVLGQTMKEIEVICIDDASPDRCGEILEHYAGQDPRVRAVHLPENRQQGYARNLGLAMARGKYVYFLDSDDCILPETLAELYRQAEEDSLDGLFFDSQPLFESPELAVRHASYPAALEGEAPQGVCGGVELLNLLSSQNQWNCYIQRQFWDRQFLLEGQIRFPEGTEHEDELFSFCAVLLAQRLRYVRRPYFIRRFRPDSVMTRKAHPKDFHGYFTIFRAMTEFALAHGLESEPGVQIQLGRIMDRCRRFYPVFAKEEAPESWFGDEEDRLLYRCFAAAGNDRLYDLASVSRLLPQLPEDRPLWIYGAGVLGRRCYRGLAAAGRVIEGFLVTDREENPSALYGRPVLLPEQAGAGCAVLALSRGYQKDIRGRMEKLGWLCVGL